MFISGCFYPAGVENAGLTKQIKARDYMIMDYFVGWRKTEEKRVMNGHIWSPIKYIVQEIGAACGLETVSGMSRALSRLEKIGCITKLKDGDGNLHIKVCELWDEIMRFRVDLSKVIRSTKERIKSRKASLHKKNYVTKDNAAAVQNELTENSLHPAVAISQIPVASSQIPSCEMATYIYIPSILKPFIKKSSSTGGQNLLKNKQKEKAVDSRDCIQSDNINHTIVKEQNQKKVEQVDKQASFKLKIDWQPDQDKLKYMLHVAGGFDSKKIDAVWIVEFASYWSCEDKALSQDQWTHKFAINCIGFFRDSQSFESKTGICPQGQPSKSKKSFSKPKQSQSSQIESINPPAFGEKLHKWVTSRGYMPPAGMEDEEVRKWVIGKERQKMNTLKVVEVVDDISVAAPDNYTDFIFWMSRNGFGLTPVGCHSEKDYKAWGFKQLRQKRDDAIERGVEFKLL